MNRTTLADFDSVFRIEGEPTDTLVGRRLLEHVSLEAFTNGRDEPGNYMIEVRTTQPEDLRERTRVAAELGIDIRDEAIPHLPSEFSEPLISSVGFELRNSSLLRPRFRHMAEALGIGAEWWRSDREHTLRIKLSVGMTAVSQGLDRLGIDNLQAHEALETYYETEELIRAVETGKVLVCGRPTAHKGIDAATALLWPLHDNVFHLYGNILLQTSEFTEFVKTHGANRDPGALDAQLTTAGATIHHMSASDWYLFNHTQAPYRQFRHFLYGFIDPKSEGAIRLNEELDAMAEADALIRQEGELDEAAAASLAASRAITDRQGNILDQLDPVVSSIISRFVRLHPHPLKF